MAEIDFKSYDDREQLAEALATGVAAVLAGGIATRGHATLAVSGGSTPKLFFRHLSGADIDWSKVMVLLVDERLVPPHSDRSNAKFVRENLLTGKAAAAKFVPYVVDLDTPEECAEASELAFDIAGHQVDAAILGMGTDGHTASFFPQGNRLFGAINLETKANVMAMEAPGAGEPRLTMTLPFLLEARFLALHFEGAEKKAVYDDALGGPDLLAMPVRAVLHQKVTPVHVFWAP